MGMNTQKSATTRELTPLEAQNYPNAKQNGQVYTVGKTNTNGVWSKRTRTVTDFVSRLPAAPLGVLNPTRPSPLPLVKNDMDILAAIGAGMGTLMKGGNINQAAKETLSPGTALPPGLRISGR